MDPVFLLAASATALAVWYFFPARWVGEFGLILVALLMFSVLSIIWPYLLFAMAALIVFLVGAYWISKKAEAREQEAQERRRLEESLAQGMNRPPTVANTEAAPDQSYPLRRAP